MRVLIHKFKTIESLTLEIPAQIKGGNGIGKSTILEAISFVLTGKQLNGKEFEQVYHREEDLHDAIADVSFFDNYNNEWRRTVKAVFQTTRAGIEEIKIKRSTECRRNDIICSDFSGEFSDFLKFGTDFFFNQKEDEQRKIFIDALKSKLPEFDVNAASIKLKELKRAQKNDVENVKAIQSAIKNTKDVVIPTIPTEISVANAEYLRLSEVDNSKAIAEINKRNNDLVQSHFAEKSGLQSEIAKLQRVGESLEYELTTRKKEYESVLSSQPIFAEAQNLDAQKAKFFELQSKLDSLIFYDEINAYAQNHFASNETLVENAKKIANLMNERFDPSTLESSACPLSGEVCETARLHSQLALKTKFEAQINEMVEALKSQNRQILTKAMNDANNYYLGVKSELERKEKISRDNDFLRASFESEKAKKCKETETSIIEIENSISKTTSAIAEKEAELSNLGEPILEKLPEQLEIPTELKASHEQCNALQIDINKAQGVNENNALLIARYNKGIKKLQETLFVIGEEIVNLQIEITKYFANLKDIVNAEFSGEIEIDVELLEYVMSKDEYKDCFKITANGKIFPYECNGALQNNTKLQVLAGLQRLKQYTGFTVMDNCESNTTQPINTCGLKCVLAFATNDNELIIK